MAKMEVSLSERRMAALPHLTSLLWLIMPFGNALGPLAVRGVIRREGFAHGHARAAAKFHLLLVLSCIVGYLLLIIGAGYIVLVLLVAVYVAGVTVGVIKAGKGEPFQFLSLTVGTRSPGNYRLWHTVLLMGLVAFGVAFAAFPSTATLKEPPVPAEPDSNLPAYAIITEAAAEIPLHEYAELSRWVYHDDRQVPSGWRWTSLISMENHLSGFFGEALQYTNRHIVIAYRGTDLEPRDLLADLALGLRVKPQQFRDAELFLTVVREKYQPVRLSLTGHSLGGALAQYVGAKNNVQTVTFNAFGVSRFVDTLPAAEPNIARGFPALAKPIVNHRAAFDVVSVAVVPFTLFDAVRMIYDGLTGDDRHHIGCTVTWPAPIRRAYQTLLWHKMAEKYNTILVNAVEAKGGGEPPDCYSMPRRRLLDFLSY